jgi:hypothetical protein
VPSASKPKEFVFQPNPAFNDYLKIHKVLVGPRTAHQLIQTAETLDKEELPQYVIAAGSAFCESALALPGEDAEFRMELLDRAEASWRRALDTQLTCAETYPALIDPADPFRTALDIARLPLLRGLVAGDVTRHTRDAVRQETLAIAAANNIRSKLAHTEGEHETACSHIGFGHELNFQIAIDSLDTPTYIATTSFARGGSGHFHPHQTHDVMLIQQKWGEILDILPVEIKAKASGRTRQRYNAMLVRGKIHMTYNVPIHEPENMRRAFAAYHLGVPARQEIPVIRDIRRTLLEMVHLYKSGQVLGSVATGRSLLRFRDLAALHQAHPEIAANKISA